jgi:diguanylate cyclase (GGDEF)-like protein
VFAHLRERSVRDVDVAARWGGEEFLLVLPGTDADGAVQLAQRIRDYVEERTLLTPEGAVVKVTASFGVAEAQAETQSAQLVAAADAALYEAKRRGKNRVGRAPAAIGHP